jgi:hypothetical protein
MLKFIESHYMIVMAAFSYISIAATSAMAPPGTPAGGWYGWFYRFSNALVPLAEQRFHLPPPMVESTPQPNVAAKTQS